MQFIELLLMPSLKVCGLTAANWECLKLLYIRFYNYYTDWYVSVLKIQQKNHLKYDTWPTVNDKIKNISHISEKKWKENYIDGILRIHIISLVSISFITYQKKILVSISDVWVNYGMIHDMALFGRPFHLFNSWMLNQ